LWFKWYHKRWGSFAKGIKFHLPPSSLYLLFAYLFKFTGTNKTDWRASYQKRLQIYELNPSRTTLAYPLWVERLNKVKKYNQEVKSGTRQFFNLRVARGEFNYLNGYVNNLSIIIYLFIYLVQSYVCERITSSHVHI
jgi:hypothetical protein